MRTLRIASLLLFVGAAVACGGGSTKNDVIAPSVSGASPNSAFLGRTLDVQLSGSATNWDTTTTVDFGMDITVNKLTVASPTALLANITVAPTATLGPRDITVKQSSTSEPFKMAFTLASAITTLVQGTPAQGSVMFLTIKSTDFAHPFDTTSMGDGLFTPLTFPNINIAVPTGVTIDVSNVTGNEVDATLTLDINAAAGKFDLDVVSGPPAGAVDHFPQPGLFTIAARTATTLGASTMTMFAGAYDSSLYKLTPTAANVDYTFDVTSTNDTAAPSLILLDKTGTFAGYINSGEPLAYFAANTDPIYIIAYDSGGTGNYSASVTSVSITFVAQAGGEGDDTMNNMSTNATLIATPPALIQGASLSSATDVDYYKIVVPMGKAIHVQTVAGDDSTPATVQFYNTDGTTALGSLNDNDGPADFTSDPVAAAGTYYFAIAYSADFTYDATESHYNLLVDLE